MNAVKHEISHDLAGYTVDDLANLFLEVYDLYLDAMSIHSALTEFISEEMQLDDLLDEVEANSTFSTTRLHTFRMSHGSVKPLVNKYVHKLFDTIVEFESTLQKFIALSFSVSDEELNHLKDLAYRVVSSCLFFLMIEFDMVDSLKDVRNCTFDNVDEVIIVACKMRYLDLRTLMGTIIYNYDKYRMHFEVFDLFPDSETQFLELMGDYACLVDDTKLTEDIVSGLFDGKISPMQVLSLTSDLTDDELAEIGDL